MLANRVNTSKSTKVCLHTYVFQRVSQTILTPLLSPGAYRGRFALYSYKKTERNNIF
jgi:hypothetical protein